MKTVPVEVKFSQVDGQAYMTKQTATFHNFANTTRSPLLLFLSSRLFLNGEIIIFRSCSYLCFAFLLGLIHYLQNSVADHKRSSFLVSK